MRLKWTGNGNATTIVVYIFESRIMEDIFKYPVPRYCQLRRFGIFA